MVWYFIRISCPCHIALKWAWNEIRSSAGVSFFQFSLKVTPSCAGRRLVSVSEIRLPVLHGWCDRWNMRFYYRSPYQSDDCLGKIRSWTIVHRRFGDSYLPLVSEICSLCVADHECYFFLFLEDCFIYLVKALGNFSWMQDLKPKIHLEDISW